MDSEKWLHPEAINSTIRPAQTWLQIAGSTQNRPSAEVRVSDSGAALIHLNRK
ncbi:hypothetical protein ACVW1C_005105 [Bradyrhizobium sp. USDA 4011]